MGIISNFVKERIEYLETAKDYWLEYLESEFKLIPFEYHKRYLNTLAYIRADAAIKLCELRIEIWKALKNK